MRSIGLTIFLVMFPLLPALAVDPPVFTTPSDGARYSATDPAPVIAWTEISSADQYEIEFGMDPEFASVFSLFSDVNQLDLEAMLGSAWDEITIQLYFHVRALNDNSPTTEWSESLEFAKTVADAPVIIGPVDDARYGVGDQLPIFKWQELTGISAYNVEFALDEEFVQSLGSFNVTGTVIDCNVDGSSDIWDLIVGTYYWRVSGLEQNLTPTPASSAQFSKTIETPTTLLSPIDKTRFSGTSTLPVFTWEPLESLPSEYHIQFAYNTYDFPMGGGYITTSDTSFTFESIQVTPAMWDLFYGKLKWRVAGLDAHGNHSTFSKPFSFIKVSNFNYMAYGDSITGGFGASDWDTGYAGYPPVLRTMLRDRKSSNINVFCQQDWSWFPGGHAYTGNEGIVKAMEHHGPGHVLIMFGIIDIVDPGAEGCEEYDCKTIENLSGIINKVRQYHGTPYLATLPPINPISERQFLQDVVEELNVDIRNLAFDQGVVLCDLEATFMELPLPLEDYFNYDEEQDKPDWAHFNDMGYHVIAESWDTIL